MFRSMTGFGSALIKTKSGLLEIEIGSVNRKHFECLLFLPREWLSLEIAAKKEIGKHIFRGQVIVRSTFYPSVEALENGLPEISLLKSLKSGWEKRAEALGYGKESVDLSFLASQLKLVSKNTETIGMKNGRTDSGIEKENFFKVLNQALKKMLLMKEKEGMLLQKDIFGRLSKVQKMLVQIEKKAQNSTDKYAEKLKERLAKLKFEDERVFKEIALFAEKVDITEELVRLESHLKQFAALKNEKEAIGRKMDFLLQEMGREVNTIASKASDVTISSAVVNIKGELEKIREQVQNIE